MEIIKSELTAEVLEMRKQWYKTLVAPLDSMWESLYIAGATVFEIRERAQLIGFCCIDQEQYLLQLFLVPAHRYQMQDVLTFLIDSKRVVGAKVSSIEPITFSACLFHATSCEADTYNYGYLESFQPAERDTPLSLRTATLEDLEGLKGFYKNEGGFDDQFGYSENLINRSEVYFYEENGVLCATGECRLSDSQTAYADVGMMVKKDQRGKGLGSRMLLSLAKIARQQDRNPICSTTLDNIGSQKAIQRAGFYRTHTIFVMKF